MLLLYAVFESEHLINLGRQLSLQFGILLYLCLEKLLKISPALCFCYCHCTSPQSAQLSLLLKGGNSRFKSALS